MATALLRPPSLSEELQLALLPIQRQSMGPKAPRLSEKPRNRSHSLLHLEYSGHRLITAQRLGTLWTVWLCPAAPPKASSNAQSSCRQQLRGAANMATKPIVAAWRLKPLSLVPRSLRVRFWCKLAAGSRKVEENLPAQKCRLFEEHGPDTITSAFGCYFGYFGRKLHPKGQRTWSHFRLRRWSLRATAVRKVGKRQVVSSLPKSRVHRPQPTPMCTLMCA